MESIIKWIHVSEKLPNRVNLKGFETSYPVLVISDGEVFVCKYVKYAKTKAPLWSNISNGLFEYDVTHWAELPDIPA